MIRKDASVAASGMNTSSGKYDCGEVIFSCRRNAPFVRMISPEDGIKMFLLAVIFLQANIKTYLCGHNQKMTGMGKYIYELTMKVRDYECDLQGIVNNANYQHYIEHTRHEFLCSEGISFARLHEQGIDPVVARLTMAFKTPLRSGDEFVSKLYLRKDGLKYVFYQDIFRLPDLKPVLRSTVETVCVVGGKLGDSKELYETFSPYLDE